MRLVLHVGAHKTASTYVQRLLRDNSEALTERGVAYCALSCRQRINELGGGKLGEHAIDELAGQIAADIASPLPIKLVSWEGLLGRPLHAGVLYGQAPLFGRLVAAISRTSGHAVDVVLYVRRQDRFLASYYIQTVKEGRAQDFSEFLAGVDIQKLDWRPAVMAFAQAADSMTVGAYEAIESSRAAFLAPLLGRLGICYQSISDGLGSFNPAYTQTALEVALLVNRALDLPQRKVQQLRRALTKAFPDEPKADPMPESCRQRIVEACREPNADLCETWLPEMQEFYSFKE